MKTLEQQLSRLDLNLLVALSVLLKEKNVTKAASVLYVSQPAMSRTLARLRELFDDPLFYRETSGLQPTQKALELETPLSELLRATQQLIESNSFDPSRCEQTFYISLPPLMSQMLSVPLVTRFIQAAPNASLIEYPAAKDPCSQLADRKVDFSIHIEKPSNQLEFPSIQIGDTYPVLYVSIHHPLTEKKEVSLNDCLKYRFVDLNLDISSNIGIQNPLDEYLSTQGLSRDIAFRSGQLATLNQIMLSTETILSSSHKLADHSNIIKDVVPILALDNLEALQIELFLIEHKRTATSAAHQWLRGLIIDTMQDVVSI